MIEYDLVPLQSLIKSSSEENLNQILSRFVCTRDHEREDFIRNLSLIFEKKGLSRTYIAFAEDSSILGYFSLGIKSIRVPDDTPASMSTRKKMNIDPVSSVAQSYLLGQLGRSDNSPKGFGEELLRNALDIIRNANDLVGCRVLRVDCSDDLVEYYTEHGFKYITKSEWNEYTHTINQMIMII